MTILDLQKKIAEGDAKLKQQQNLYEAVRSDRNLYSKNLIESQDEIAEMKRKFKIMNHQIEQLKEEIQAKDQAYVKERIEHSRSDKEKEALKNELMRIKKLVSTAETTMKNYQAEVRAAPYHVSEVHLPAWYVPACLLASSQSTRCRWTSSTTSFRRLMQSAFANSANMMLS